VLVSLDVTMDVIKEAKENNCNLIVAHHPIVFRGLKRINGTNYVEQVMIDAIKNDIAIYAAHTNLDNIVLGVNGKIAKKLGLKNTRAMDLPLSGFPELSLLYRTAAASSCSSSSREQSPVERKCFMAS